MRTRLDEEHEFLIGEQQLEQDLRDWQTVAADKKVEALLSGLKLSRAREWIVRCPAHLSSDEREFIEASIARQDAVAAYKKPVLLHSKATSDLCST